MCTWTTLLIFHEQILFFQIMYQTVTGMKPDLTGVTDVRTFKNHHINFKYACVSELLDNSVLARTR